MSEKGFTEALQASALGKVLSSGQCRVLAQALSARTLADGEVLINEGEKDESLFLLRSGRLAVTRDVAGGDQLTLHVMKPGDLAGEMGFITGDEHIASLHALGETEVLVLPRRRFEELVETHPRLVYEVMRTIARSVHNTLARLNAQFIELQNYVTKTHGRY
jgi:CRP-like cAMP-binding protein